MYSTALTSMQVLGLGSETQIEIETGRISDCGGLALQLPFDSDINDARCNQAQSLEVGSGVINFVDDPERGRVAHFDGSTALEVG